MFVSFAVVEVSEAMLGERRRGINHPEEGRKRLALRYRLAILPGPS